MHFKSHEIEFRILFYFILFVKFIVQGKTNREKLQFASSFQTSKQEATQKQNKEEEKENKI
jgi:hypothetical protein